MADKNKEDIRIRVFRDGKTEEICAKEGESLHDALVRGGYYVNAPCGGKGRCGKCGVQVLKGKAPAGGADRKTFSDEELEAGWRLSCQLPVSEGLEIVYSKADESGFEVLTASDGAVSAGSEGTAEIGGAAAAAGLDRKKTVPAGESTFDIAIDIGTTTVAMELLGADTGKVICTAAGVNTQRMYGADVISRIQASVDGKGEELQNCIRTELKKLIGQLLTESGASVESIRHIAIGGNTTMGHLLMGYNCKGLGIFPFTPVNIDFIKGSCQETLGLDAPNAEAILLPGVSTYVGGDIVSGLYACDFQNSPDICLLVDLGTNGEMALGNKDKILVTSTAAGPAFEGGNIQWGTGSVPGAICAVKLDGEKAEIRTIGDQPPVGICGTGVVETVAELVRTELVDEAGTLDDDYFDDGYPLAKTPEGETIAFTKKDVREIQLAKAAIRAGMETLLLKYGIEKKDVARVYIAGGFGYRLDIEKAIAIGMIPEEFRGRTEAIGNSSLAGAVKYLREGCPDSILKELVNTSTEVELASDKNFNEFYIDSMFFETD